MKRLMLIGLCLIVAGAYFVVGLAGPALIRAAFRSTPYDVTVGHVTATPWSGITLRNIHLRFRKPDEAWGHIEQIRIGLIWRALWKREVMITHLSVVEPHITLVRREDGSLWTTIPPTPEKPASAWVLLARSIDVQDGEVEWVDRSRTPAGNLVIRDLELQASYAADRVAIKRFSAAIANGTLTAQGAATLKPAIAADFTFETQKIQVERLVEAVQTPPKPLRVSQSGKGSAHYGTDGWRLVMEGQLSGSPYNIAAYGDSARFHAEAALSALPITKVWRDPQFEKFGVLTGRVNASGDFHDLQSTNAEGEILLRLNEARARRGGESFSAQFDLKAGRGPVNLRLSAPGLLAQAAGQANVGGPSFDGRFDVMLTSFTQVGKAQGPEGKSGSVKGALAFDQKTGVSVQADLQDMVMHHAKKSPWDIPQAHVEVKGKQPRWAVIWESTFRNRVTTSLSGFVERQADQTRLEWTQLRLSPSKQDVWEAREGGSALITAQAITLDRLRFDRMGVRVTTAPAMEIMGQIPLQPTGTYALHVQAPALDPALWLSFLPDVTTASGGALQLDVAVTGTPLNMKIQGQAVGQIPLVELHAFDLKLKNIQLDVHAENETLQIRTFTAETPKGFIRITGKSRLPALDYRLDTDRFAFTHDSGLKADTAVALHLGGTLTAPQVEGKIQIRSATYRPPEKKKSEADAEVQTSTGPAASSVWVRSQVDVAMTWERNVWYRDGVTGIETSGDLRIQKAPSNADLVLVGDISLVRGSYNLYGRDFQLDRGQVQFTGATPINPTLNVEASFHREPTVVYLAITGTVHKPVPTLRSSPPLSQQDIIAVLIYGAPVQSLSNASGSTRQQDAMRAVGGLAGGFIAKELRRTGVEYLTLDTLDIQPAARGGQLTAGRYITQNLFVSYAQALGGSNSGSSALGAEYYLTPRITLKGQAGSFEQNYLDLLFRYPLNRGAEVKGQTLRETPFKNNLETDPLR